MDYGYVLTPEVATGENGPLYWSSPGDLTRWMALPWQTDSAGCRAGYTPEYDPYLPTFWPARVPNHVFTAESYQEFLQATNPVDRGKAFGSRAQWLRFLKGGLNEQMQQMSAQIDQLKRSLLDLNGTIDAQRADNAKLRGQMEELARVVAEVQRKQADLVQGVDERIRKVEPQKVTVDDKEFSVDPEEKRSYDDALVGFRKGEFDRAATGFSALLKRFPSTGYRASALFWLGNAQYAKRDYKEAIASFRSLVVAAPESPRAPEALLAIANCQAELKDPKAARKTIDELVKTYPRSEAAQAGRERLATLK